MRIALTGIWMTLMMATAAGQEWNCDDPSTQTEMTVCAGQMYEAADGDLNLAWDIARSAAERMDEYLAEGEVPAVEILLDAQRAWLTYRDKTCEAESLLGRGGTIQSQLRLNCLERVTRARTEDLRYFGEVN